MATLKSRLGHSFTGVALRSYLAEFISTFIFVFASIGSIMASHKTAASSAGSSSLFAIAIANALGLGVAVYIASNISGGHVNPAVTFGMLLGGHITIPMAIFYAISQMLGSVMACLLLKTTTVGQNVPIAEIAQEMTGFGAAILEGVMTFALVYTVYSSMDRRRLADGSSAIGPLAIGFIVGANILASGPFTGGSMNPACAFGSAVVSGRFKNHAVYWVGPLIGAGFAGILYENVMFPRENGVPQSLRGVSDQAVSV